MTVGCIHNPVSILNYIQRKDRRGFEPRKHITVYMISNQAPSATRTPIHGAGNRALTYLSAFTWQRFDVEGFTFKYSRMFHFSATKTYSYTPSNKLSQHFYQLIDNAYYKVRTCDIRFTRATLYQLS